MTDTELFALAVIVQSQNVEVMAANQERECLQQAPAYTGFIYSNEFEALKEEVRRRLGLQREEGK